MDTSWTPLFRRRRGFTGGWLASLFLLICLVTPNTSSASVFFFDSIQFGPSVVDPFGYAVGDLNNVYNQPAQRFVAAVTGQVDQISFGAEGTDVDFFVRLWADGVDGPGTLLEELVAPNIPPGLAVHSVLSSSHPLLNAGSTYWVSLSTTSTTIGQHNTNSGEWRWSNGPFLGGDSIAVALDSTSGGPWVLDARDFQATMLRVEGTSVPEPGTLTLLAVSGLAFGARLRTYRKRN